MLICTWTCLISSKTMKVTRRFPVLNSLNKDLTFYYKLSHLSSSLGRDFFKDIKHKRSICLRLLGHLTVCILSQHFATPPQKSTRPPEGLRKLKRAWVPGGLHMPLTDAGPSHPWLIIQPIWAIGYWFVKSISIQLQPAEYIWVPQLATMSVKYGCLQL